MKDIEIILNSFSINDAAKNLFGYSNNTTVAKIKNLLFNNGYKLDIFSGKNKNTKNPRISKKCPVCGGIFITKNGDKKEKTTCSISCSNSYKPKRKKSNIPRYKRYPTEIICNHCNLSFVVGRVKKDQLYCSISCASKAKWKIAGYRENMVRINSILAKKRHSDPDDNFGWTTRKKLKPSYPESIAMRILDKLEVNYEWELPFGKYFIDFALVEKLIAIEIDGQQHNKPERAKTDREKDKLLIDNGWTVYRIKWPEDNIIESIKKIIKII